MHNVGPSEGGTNPTLSPQTAEIQQTGASTGATMMGSVSQNAAHLSNYGKRLFLGDEEEEMVESMWPHFTSKTANGMVDINQLEQICEEVGIECDIDMLRRVIKTDKQSTIYFQDAVEAVLLGMRFTKDDIYEDDIDDLENQKVLLSPWGFMLYRLNLFGPYDPEKEYVMVWELCFTAKNLLVLSTLVVFAMVAAALIAFSSVTWMQGAIDREKEMISNFQNALFLFAESLEKRLVDAHADSILDTSNTAARWTEFVWNKTKVETKNDLRSQHETTVLMQQHLHAQKKNDIQSVKENLAAVSDALEHASSGVDANVIVAAVKKWLVDGARIWQVAVNSTQTSPPKEAIPFHDRSLHDHCHYPKAADGSLRRVTTITDLPDGGGVITSYMEKAQIAVCLYYSDEDFKSLNRAESVKYINSLRNLPRHSTAISTAQPTMALWDIATVPTFKTFTVGENGVITHQEIGNVTRMDPLTIEAKSMIDKATNTASGLPVEFLQQLEAVWRDKNVDSTCGVSWIYPNERFMWCASYEPQTQLVQTTMINLEILAADFRTQLRLTVEDMNWKFSRTTEIVIGGREAGSGDFKAQATTFRFAEGCYGECGRFLESSQSAYKAIQTQGSGAFIAPDYRPEPVVTTYAYMAEGLDVPIVIERDVRDLRSVVLGSMVDIVNQVNRQARANQEVQLLRYESLPTMPFFDPEEACPQGTFCLERAGNHSGIVFRVDCADCERAPALDHNASIKFLTELRYEGDCAGACPSFGRGDSSLAKDAVEQNELSAVAPDYTGKNVLASSRKMEKLSTSLLVKVYEDSVVQPILVSIGVSSAIAAGLSIVGLAIVMWSTTRVLKRIEDEWHANKVQLEAERVRFVRYTDFLVPRHVIRKVRSGHSMVAENSTSANVLCIDVCGFSDLSKGWPHGQVIRFATYLHYVIDETLALYGIFKLKSFGDAVIGVSGFGKHKLDQFVRAGEDNTNSSMSMGSSKGHGVSSTSSRRMHSTSSGATDASLKHYHAQASPVENAMECAIVLVRLMSQSYCHIPTFKGKSGHSKKSYRHRTAEGICASIPPDSQATKDHSKNSLNMPSIRVGIAVGPLVSGYVHTGKTPRFDCYGPTLLVATRMQLTSQPNRVHVSNTFKEEYVVARQGKLQVLDFENPRKTIIKGRTTVVSYLVKEADIHPPETFAARLGIFHAHRRFIFNFQELQRNAAISESSSVYSRSTARSSRSSRSKRSTNSGGSL